MAKLFRDLGIPLTDRGLKYVEGVKDVVEGHPDPFFNTNEITVHGEAYQKNFLSQKDPLNTAKKKCA